MALSQSVLMTKHLFIECDIDEVFIEIEYIFKNSLAYSIITLVKNKKIISLSSTADTIPIFIAENKADAADIVSELTGSPFQTIRMAINSSSVIFNYLSGCPT